MDDWAEIIPKSKQAEYVSILKKSRGNKPLKEDLRKSGIYCINPCSKDSLRCCLFCKKICEFPKCWNQDHIRKCEGRIGVIEAFLQKL